MTGIISGIKRMEIHDGDGLRTTVFFKGCSLKCIWCHNPESISFEKQIAKFENKCCHCGTCAEVCERGDSECKMCMKCVDSCPTEAIKLYGEEYDADTLADILAQDEEFFKNSGGGVTFSGGECLMQPEFALKVAMKLHAKGISVYVDTCGFVSREAIDKIMPYADKFLYDIKAIDPDVHKACTGQTNEIILDNLRYLCDRGCAVEVRYPLVKGYNDGECAKIGEFLQGKRIDKVKVLQYHSFASSRYAALGMECTMPDTETAFEDVENAVNILRSYGINAVNGITDD